jgi:ribosomal protein S12 methylthiotransferase accessory factor
VPLSDAALPDAALPDAALPDDALSDATSPSMAARLSWKPAFHVEVVEPNRVFLLTEARSFALAGRGYRHVAPLLDGTRTADEIVEALADILPAPETRRALTLLEERGYISAHRRSTNPGVDAFWHLEETDPAAAAGKLKASPVAVRVLGNVPAAALTTISESLREMGLTLGDERVGRDDAAVDDSAVKIVLVDDYLQDGLDDINRAEFAAGRSWLIAKPVGSVLWLGPVFQPGAGPCWECLADRIRGNRQVEGYVLSKVGQSAPLPTSIAMLPSTADVAAGLIGTTAASWIARGRDERLLQTLVTVDLATLETRRHHVVRRPQCTVCGSPSRQTEPAPVVLRSQKKVFDEDGGFRTVTPDETYERLKHHVSPITGVISSLEKLTVGGNPFAHSYSAGHNFAMMSDSLFFLRQNLRGRSGGKGATDMQAKVGGMCEAIERYSGVLRGDEITRRASYRELGPEAIHPNACMGFSEGQFANRRAWNAVQPHTKFHLVPDPLDETRPIDWTPVYSLTNDRFGLLPTALAYFGHRDLADHFFCLADSNGTAAGNTIEEAILQAFLEIVERDAVAIWWYNRLRRPGIDIDSFNVPYLKALGGFYKSIGRDFWAVDITTDLGIPVVAGISRRVNRGSGAEDIIVGFGAHLDPGLALLRAITEVNQFLPAVSRQNPDGSTYYWFHDPDAIDWWRTATVAAHPHVTPDPAAPLRKKTDYPVLAGTDLKADVETLVAAAARAGLETFVLDQTRADVGLPVARVIVPGMRHFWRRLGGGRLYDVPQKMGWLREPIAEADLNPISIFF